MRSRPIFVAAAGFAMLGACSVTTKEDNADAEDNGAAAASTEGSVEPMAGEEAAGPADTLGNQLNQLNADAGNAAEADTNQQ